MSIEQKAFEHLRHVGNFIIARFHYFNLLGMIISKFVMVNVLFIKIKGILNPNFRPFSFELRTRFFK